MPTPAGKKTILIVEDELPMLGALAEKFTDEGFAVTKADNGADAVTWAKRDKPDVILLDIMLPKMNGMDVLHQIRTQDEWGKKVPIIVLTNLTADEKIMHQVSADEPSYYLVKTDWKLYEVVEKVRNCLK